MALIVLIFNFFRQMVNPDPTHMNFSFLITGTIMLFTVVYYYTYAREVYTGPALEITPYQVL